MAKRRLHIFGMILALWGLSTAAHALEELPEVLISPLSTPDVEAPVWGVVDFNSGFILAGEKLDRRVEPASLTKLLTAYVVFSDLAEGSVRLDEMVRISERAWQAPGSRTFLEVGSQATVEDLLLGLIVQSGNDASVALAEHLSGSEESFALRMNYAAEQLGMDSSSFTNASGLPDRKHYSTLRDLIRLSIALIRNFPQYYKYYSRESFTYNGISQPNRNELLGVEAGVDGIKTGFTEKAGYGLIASVERDGRRVVAAVLGTDSAAERIRQVRELLSFAYIAYDSRAVAEAGEALGEIPLWYGQAQIAEVGAQEAFHIVYPRRRGEEISTVLQVPAEIDAPLSTEQEIGKVQISYAGTQLGERPLYPIADYPLGSMWKRLIDWFKRHLPSF